MTSNAAARDRAIAAVSIALLLSACATVPPAEDGSLAGRIFDARAQRFIAPEELFNRAVESRFVILGETHDNPTHHRLQAEVLAEMVRAGRRPALAMEQFDREHQAALDAARARGVLDPEAIADAGRLDRKGWRWPDYKPLVALAAGHGLEIIAANFSREEARTLIRSGRPHEGLQPAPAAVRMRLEQDIVRGDCGIRPSATTLAGMIEVQRARDSKMAAALVSGGLAGTVLIAGAGHARRSRGVPAYLPAPASDSLLVIAFVEVESGKASAWAYANDDDFDILWFTAPAPREDPCATFRLPAPK